MNIQSEASTPIVLSSMDDIEPVFNPEIIRRQNLVNGVFNRTSLLRPSARLSPSGPWVRQRPAESRPQP